MLLTVPCLPSCSRTKFCGRLGNTGRVGYQSEGGAGGQSKGGPCDRLMLQNSTPVVARSRSSSENVCTKYGTNRYQAKSNEAAAVDITFLGRLPLTPGYCLQIHRCPFNTAVGRVSQIKSRTHEQKHRHRHRHTSAMPNAAP